MSVKCGCRKSLLKNRAGSRPKVAVSISDYTWDLKESLIILTNLKKTIGKPFILNAGTLDNHLFQYEGSYKDTAIPINHAVHNFLAKLAKESNLWKLAGKICNEDLKWGEKRNAGLTGKYYYRFTLKPAYQKKLLTFLNDYIQRTRTNLNQVVANDKREKERRVVEKAKYSVKVLNVQKPSGGENGRDGYSVSILTNSLTGSSVTMIERNVFDFGYYNYPKRLEGSKAIFSRDKWNSDEIDAGNWLIKHSLISTGMRM